MTPVDQTIFGDGKDGRPIGNCFAACIASLLDLPLDDVPNFLEKGDAWTEQANRWLGKRGLFYLEGNFSGEFFDEIMAGAIGFHVRVGQSPRGDYLHAVIGERGGRMVHDPHPSRSGLVAGTDSLIGFLIPLDPAFTARSWCYGGLRDVRAKMPPRIDDAL